MGQWKVRTLIARDIKTGNWEILDGPANGRKEEQRGMLHDITDKHGVYEGKQYDIAGIQQGFVKRRKFSIDKAEAAVKTEAKAAKKTRAVKTVK